MLKNHTSTTPEITISLVKKLLAEQFPQWANLSVIKVEPGGHDNRTFCLGEQMLVRMPSSEDYAEKVLIEQKWLPKLAPFLSFPIPDPIAMGVPSQTYPWNWSIYKWIEGQSANTTEISESNLRKIAVQLAEFLKELQKIDISENLLLPGQHNFWRGAHPSIYDADTRKYISQLNELNLMNAKAAEAVWEKAVSSKWNKNPVWLHGDLASGNILIKNNLLCGVIDFGGMAVGDPACDLAIAWTLFINESRKLFKEHLNLDSETWARARGWVLWKACFELIELKDKAGFTAKKHLQIIDAVIKEHELKI